MTEAPPPQHLLDAEQPGRLHHASPGRLPVPGCGIATCLKWAIDMAGLPPAGLQPCWLLLPALRFPADFASEVMRPAAQPPLLDHVQRHHDHATQPSPAGRGLVATSCRLPSGIISRSCLGLLTTPCRQQGPFARRALPRVSTTTDPSATRSSHPPLPRSTGYKRSLLQGLSPWDETGFSSCSVCPVSPCCRCNPADVT